MSFKMFISSNNRQSGDTISDFTLSFSDTGRYYSQATDYTIGLESVIIPNLEYNINEYNNKLYIIENNVTNRTITIPVRNYSAEQLRAQLETALNDASPLIYTVIYNDQTKKYTWSVPLPDVFRILDGLNSINRAVGVQGETVLGAAVSSEYPIDLSGLPYVDIEIVGIQNGNFHTGGLNQVFARVPMSEPFGYYINYINPDAAQSIRFSEDILYSLRLRFKRPDGRKILIPETTEIALVLKAVPLI